MVWGILNARVKPCEVMSHNAVKNLNVGSHRFLPVSSYTRLYIVCCLSVGALSDKNISQSVLVKPSAISGSKLCNTHFFLFVFLTLDLECTASRSNARSSDCHSHCVTMSVILAITSSDAFGRTRTSWLNTARAWTDDICFRMSGSRERLHNESLAAPRRAANIGSILGKSIAWEREDGLDFVLEPKRLQRKERRNAYTIKRCTPHDERVIAYTIKRGTPHDERVTA